MDGTGFVDRLESELTTEMNRYGSQKLLLALTAADLERDPVLQVAATEMTAAHELYEAWAADSSSSTVADAMAAAGDRQRTHRSRLSDELDFDPEMTDDRPPVYEALRECTTPIERTAAGLVALPMLRSRMYTQIIGFFINEAATRPTDLFREFKTETETAITDGESLLVELCGDDATWTTAETAATTTIETAYEDYAATLEGMGLDPRPIC